jgi:hypothetical protein
VDLNFDPRDEHQVRPQVSFRLNAAGYDSREFFREFQSLGIAYHDLMLFDAAGGEVPGVVRFDWDTEKVIVDAAAKWLEGLPGMVGVLPSYGGPMDPT